LRPTGRARQTVPAILLALALAASACGRSAPPAAPRPQTSAKPAQQAAGPVFGGTITTAFSSDMPTLDPGAAGDIQTMAVTQLMYESLVTYMPTGAELMPGLADRWTWSDGNRTLTLHIDPRARFADGAPVTSADVLFSLERMMNPEEKAPYASSFSDVVGYSRFVKGRAKTVAGIAAVDPATVRIDLKTPEVFFLNLLALPSAAVLEKSRVEAAPGGEFGNWWATRSFGSGPYVLDRWVKGQRLTLKANPNYWRRGTRAPDGVEFGPFASTIVYQLQVQGPQQVLEFEKGQLDYLSEPVPSSAYLQIMRSARWKRDYHSQPQMAVFYTGMNVRMAPFNDLRVREAVAYAIDKQRIVQVLNGRGQVAGSFLPPLMPGHDAALRPYPYDPARAKALLREAGYVPGAPIDFYVPDINVMSKAAAVVQQDLQAVGIPTSIRKEKWDVFLKDVSTPGRAPLVQLGWLEDYPDPQDFVYNLFNSASAVRGGNNASFYSNGQVDALEARADADADEATRLADYRRIQQIIYKDVPIVPEFYPTNDTLVQPWLDDQGHIQLILHPVMQPQLDKVWVEPHKGP
jgi:oligopeptide transport system substrate-binding protein